LKIVVVEAEDHRESSNRLAQSVRTQEICLGDEMIIMNKPTGVWKFSQNKSVLEIPALILQLFIIEHREPYFHLERTHSWKK